MIPSFELDTDDPRYLAFRDCIARGASRQDIYADSPGGFGQYPSAASENPATDVAIDARARIEFSRIRAHACDLVAPVARHYVLRDKCVLEFGCGSGALSVAMALAGARVTALDPSVVNLEATGHRAAFFDVGGRVHPVAYNSLPELPFADDSFGLVISNSVLEFIPSGRDAYIGEMLRVLKPGGHLVVSTENGNFPLDYYTRMPLPRLRRQRARSQNWPYGVTWRELHSWATARRGVRDLSPENRFNSFDKLASRLQVAGRIHTARLLGNMNLAFRGMCRAVGIPSDVFLPYSTFVFQVAQPSPTVELQVAAQV